MRNDCDLLVVGAGVAGMTAALVAALEGLQVILCESSQQVGGTSATSAGTIWIPGNSHAAGAGHADEVEFARCYLDALLGPEDPRGLRAAFLASGATAIDDIERRTDVAFLDAGRHPDYCVLPGSAEVGRALSPVPFDGRQLGADFDRVRPPIPEFMVLGGMMVGKSDIGALVDRWRSWPAFRHSSGLVLRYLADRLRHRRGTRLVLGNALVARLLASLRTAGVPIRFGWQLSRLCTEGGRVTGASFEVDGRLRDVSSTAGVILATGGVGHDAALMRELGAPAGRTHVLACESVRGSGIRAALAAGAVLEQHEGGNFFWQPVSQVPRQGGDSGWFAHLFLDRAKPGLIAVDERGHRFVNEATSYHHFVEALLTHQHASGTRRSWLICNGDFVRRHGLGVIPPGTTKLARWIASGYVQAGPTLQQLAERTGIDVRGLSSTVECFNANAAAGRDVEFHKGETPVDRFNGDPGCAPNPCLGALDGPPYLALPIHPGIAGSSAGLATDIDSRVLRADGQCVDGLYACGNDAASPMRGTYPGPGITLGPGMVFAYRAARHAASSHSRDTPGQLDTTQRTTPFKEDLQHA